MQGLFNRIRTSIAARPDFWIGAALCVSAFVLYAPTMPLTVLDGDSGEYQYMAYILGVPHSSGYPFYILIAKLFTFLPVGDVAYRVNLFSVVAAALSAPIVYWIARRLGLERFSAIMATAILLVTPSLWGGAVQAKTYALHFFLGVLTIFFALRWHQEDRRRDFYAAAFVFGLGLTNHHVVVFLAPALLLMLWMNRARFNRAMLTRGVLLALVPLLLYAYIPIRANQLIAQQDPANKLLYPREDAMVKGTVTAYYNNTPQGFFLLITGLDNYFKIGYLSNEERTSRFTDAARLLLEQFGIGIVLVVVGAVVSFRRDRQSFALLAAIAAGIAFVALILRGISTVYYFSLCYFALAMWVGFGIDVVQFPLRFPSLRGAGKIALIFLPLYALIINYPRLDRSNDYTARKYAQAALRDNIAQNAIVIAPWEVVTPMRYLQFVENQRPDLLIANVSPIWPQFTSLHDKASELGRAFYNVEFNPEFKNGNEFRSVQAVPLPLRDEPRPKYTLPKKKIVDEVEVIGYDLDPDPPIPGRPARVLIYYRTLARMYPLYSSVLSVNDILGKPVKDLSSFPASFFYPTYRWQKGDTYRDTYALVLPADVPTGLYTLDLNWYPYDLESRTSDYSKENRLALGSIRVGDFNAPASIAHAQNARFGDVLTFLAWDSQPRATGEAISVGRGQSLKLDLFWRADRAMKESYTVFAHLVDASGKIIADADSPPFSGLYGTELWSAGESLRDRHTLAIPANIEAGKYSIEIGMYLSSNGNRLPIQSASGQRDKIILAQVNVR